MKEKGIVLMTFGKPAYAYAAYNMAVSLKKHSPDIPIALAHDENVAYLVPGWESLFDLTFLLDHKDYRTNGKIDPGKAKVHIYKYLPFKHNLYLDVDGLCLKDITPLFERLIADDRDFLCETHGSGGKADKIGYAIWAKNEDVWDHFNIPKDATMYGIQTSMFYVHKRKETSKLFRYAKSKFDFPMNKLTHGWGGTMPDELIISGALAHYEMNPDMIGKAIFFGNRNVPGSDQNIIDKNYILSIYGNGEGRTLTKYRYLKMYNRVGMRTAQALGRRFYKHETIMSGKHANNR